ncbi:S24 family peptidase [Qipengyuania thermophila]|uniref:S24 family peptidase n=1 Tax=Qipengyuania thermophila TaxID=2509361 RepID=UPI001F41C3F6|nr:LexA family transcriptional regulator [Qipengyuania thermophila]
MASHADDPREVLLAAAKAADTSLSRLSVLIGRNPSYLHQFVTRGSPRRLDERARRILSQFLQVSERSLGAEENSHAEAAADGGWAEIPRLDLGASAGGGAVAMEETPYDALRFSRRWLRTQGLTADRLSVIRVAGDSMEPVLRDGDEILVDRSAHRFRDGLHVVRLGDALLVKRVASQGFGRVMLISENKAYPPVEVATEELEIIGRVVWKGGRV